MSVLICSICLEAPQRPVAAPCGHVYCADCLDAHAKSRLRQSRNHLIARCPTCRVPFCHGIAKIAGEQPHKCGGSVLPLFLSIVDPASSYMATSTADLTITQNPRAELTTTLSGLNNVILGREREAHAMRRRLSHCQAEISVLKTLLKFALYELPATGLLWGCSLYLGTWFLAMAACTLCLFWVIIVLATNETTDVATDSVDGSAMNANGADEPPNSNTVDSPADRLHSTPAEGLHDGIQSGNQSWGQGLVEQSPRRRTRRVTFHRVEPLRLPHAA